MKFRKNLASDKIDIDCVERFFVRLEMYYQFDYDASAALQVRCLETALGTLDGQTLADQWRRINPNTGSLDDSCKYNLNNF